MRLSDAARRGSPRSLACVPMAACSVTPAMALPALPVVAVYTTSRPSSPLRARSRNVLPVPAVPNTTRCSGAGVATPDAGSSDLRHSSSRMATMSNAVRCSPTSSAGSTGSSVRRCDATPAARRASKKHAARASVSSPSRWPAAPQSNASAAARSAAVRSGTAAWPPSPASSPGMRGSSAPPCSAASASSSPSKRASTAHSSAESATCPSSTSPAPVAATEMPACGPVSPSRHW
mmetsp:Transcript_56082/g.114190  ORF Transcript_56082/g.114190 Transcript_56082/m.114190 type:complete len:234 (-) Transcript_56082:4776-5477(-)